MLSSHKLVAMRQIEIDAIRILLKDILGLLAVTLEVLKKWPFLTLSEHRSELQSAERELQEQLVRLDTETPTVALRRLREIRAELESQQVHIKKGATEAHKAMLELEQELKEAPR